MPHGVAPPAGADGAGHDLSLAEPDEAPGGGTFPEPPPGTPPAARFALSAAPQAGESPGAPPAP
ncbi:hypothetical protein [Streptomyces sp. NPDC050856]|uniref:hypothetical protein n=1 Tax=Streptomyces sp. NPDC050856 TaxID=3154939 RepID=UPI0033D09D5F